MGHVSKFLHANLSVVIKNFEIFLPLNFSLSLFSILLLFRHWKLQKKNLKPTHQNKERFYDEKINKHMRKNQYMQATF